jgi:hypothetical protein
MDTVNSEHYTIRSMPRSMPVKVLNFVSLIVVLLIGEPSFAVGQDILYIAPELHEDTQSFCIGGSRC